MRLIFLTLVGVNLIVAIWGVFFRDSPNPALAPVAQPLMESKVKTITAKNDFSDSDQGREELELKPAAESQMCELIGAFASDEDAEIFKERLYTIDIESEIKHVELATGASYWVHLPIEETSAAAYKKLAELQALKVESYVIGKGDLKNAVSLGVFTKEPLAYRKRDELSEMGFDPVITTKPRTEIEIWVSVSPEYAQKISDLTWDTMLEGMSSQERRQNFCLPVASGDNFH